MITSKADVRAQVMSATRRARATTWWPRRGWPRGRGAGETRLGDEREGGGPPPDLAIRRPAFIIL